MHSQQNIKKLSCGFNTDLYPSYSIAHVRISQKRLIIHKQKFLQWTVPQTTHSTDVVTVTYQSDYRQNMTKIIYMYQMIERLCLETYIQSIQFLCTLKMYTPFHSDLCTDRMPCAVRMRHFDVSNSSSQCVTKLQIMMLVYEPCFQGWVASLA